MFHMFFLVKYCKALEEGSFRSRSADFLWMLVFGACCPGSDHAVRHWLEPLRGRRAQRCTLSQTCVSSVSFSSDRQSILRRIGGESTQHLFAGLLTRVQQQTWAWTPQRDQQPADASSQRQRSSNASVSAAEAMTAAGCSLRGDDLSATHRFPRSIVVCTT